MENFRIRLKIYWIILLFVIGTLIASLFYAQVVMHEKYIVMSEDNRLKIIPLMAPRGSIYDRNMEPMAKDVLCFDVSVIYSRVKNLDLIVNVLSSILDMSPDIVSKNLKKSKTRPFTPICVAEDIGLEKAVKIEEITQKYPGMLLEVSAKRRYFRKKVASNVLGYLGSINRSEFKRLKSYGYKMDDVVGRAGVEKYYDKYLRGVHGGKQVEVDHRGREAKILGFKEPAPGRDLYLTIDLSLQEFCDSLLEDRRGSVIVINPESGALLAMASAPTFDPTIFINKNLRDERRRVLTDKNYPLLNRGISGTYPPGSVFKAVVAAAALDTKAISLSTSFECNYIFTLGRAKFRCWRKGGHGPQSVMEALKHSCNIFFFNTGLCLGVDRLSVYAGKFGFGQKTGVDLPGERSGVLPSREWKKKVIKDKWYKGDTVNFSIGQGYLLCSPLQIARMMCVFANGGYLVKPYVAEKIGDVEVSDIRREPLNISKEVLMTVKKGLYEVVNGKHGTGVKAKQKDVDVSGKTGTAQTSRGKSHGWFAGFAPYEDPKIVVVVFDEFGGKGGYYAAGTAGKVFKKAKELGII